MDRKKTILIAVMMNAGLLIVLFVAAVATREESTPPVEVGQAAGRSREILPQPLFHDGGDFGSQQTMTELVKPVEIPLVSLSSSSSADEPPKHKLPELSSEGAEPLQTAVQASASVLEQPVAKAAPLSALEITVQKGDSLEKIARKHHTSVDELIKLNRLPSNFLKVGQHLKVPAGKSATASLAPKPSLPPSSEKAEYYTMKVGDNPWTIAMKHHIKVDELLKLNGLNEKTARKLRPGDRLRIR